MNIQNVPSATKRIPKNRPIIKANKQRFIHYLSDNLDTVEREREREGGREGGWEGEREREERERRERDLEAL